MVGGRQTHTFTRSGIGMEKEPIWAYRSRNYVGSKHVEVNIYLYIYIYIYINKKKIYIYIMYILCPFSFWNLRCCNQWNRIRLSLSLSSGHGTVPNWKTKTKPGLLPLHPNKEQTRKGLGLFRYTKP